MSLWKELKAVDESEYKKKLQILEQNCFEALDQLKELRNMSR